MKRARIGEEYSSAGQDWRIHDDDDKALLQCREGIIPPRSLLRGFPIDVGNETQIDGENESCMFSLQSSSWVYDDGERERRLFAKMM